MIIMATNSDTLDSSSNESHPTKTKKRVKKDSTGQSHFKTLLGMLQECLLTHRWHQAGKILSSMCLYSAIPSDASVGKGMPGVELIWKCGIEMLYHHPDSTHADITQFHRKRYQLDTKVSKQQSLLEHAFYLLREQKLKEAYEVIKKKGSLGKPQNVYPPGSTQAKHEKCTLQNQWKDIIIAYTGLIAYMLWYQTGSEGNTGSKKEADKYWELATINLGQIADKSGVWDTFVSKHIELLCSRGEVSEAVSLAEKYRDANPANPNAHKYLYHLMKTQGAENKSLIEVLKDIVERLPSDELVLEYVDVLRQENKHCHKDYLPPLFDMLDYVCWQGNIKPWKALADRLQAIHLKKSVAGIKAMRSCWRSRQAWWGDYHFHCHHAIDIAKQDKLLAVEKAIAAIFLLNPDCVFVAKIVKYFHKMKKRKCVKRINCAKEAYKSVQTV